MNVFDISISSFFFTNCSKNNWNHWLTSMVHFNILVQYCTLAFPYLIYFFEGDFERPPFVTLRLF